MRSGGCTASFRFASRTQAFSLAFHDSGLRVAYLPYETARHIGVGDVGSAYELNDFDRDWYRGGEWGSSSSSSSSSSSGGSTASSS